MSTQVSSHCDEVGPVELPGGRSACHVHPGLQPLRPNKDFPRQVLVFTLPCPPRSPAIATRGIPVGRPLSVVLPCPPRSPAIATPVQSHLRDPAGNPAMSTQVSSHCDEEAYPLCIQPLHPAMSTQVSSHCDDS